MFAKLIAASAFATNLASAVKLRNATQTAAQSDSNNNDYSALMGDFFKTKIDEESQTTAAQSDENSITAGLGDFFKTKIDEESQTTAAQTDENSITSGLTDYFKNKIADESQTI